VIGLALLDELELAFSNQAPQDIGRGPGADGLAQMGFETAVGLRRHGVRTERLVTRRNSSLTNFFPGGGSFGSTFAGAGFTTGPTSSTTDEETALKASRFCRTFSSSA
jgi:hypothetical protein